MYNIDCKKILSLLSLFIEDKLDDENKFIVETHLLKCGDCYKKYIEMKNVMSNLHFEYEKLVDEFNKIDTDKTFNIKEYENFYNNISPYIDDELSYEDSLKFRKYLLSSKTARKDLSNAYKLRNNIKQSVTGLENNLNFNFSKKILKRLKEENNDGFDFIYKKAIIALSIIITSLIAISFIGLNYINKNMFHKSDIENTAVTNVYSAFPKEEDMIEFTFDENKNALLTAK